MRYRHRASWLDLHVPFTRRGRPRFAPLLRVLLPHLPALEELLLPDGHRRLELVDGPVRRLERLTPVRAGHRYDHAALAHAHRTRPVHHRDLRHVPPRTNSAAQLAHLSLGHRFVALVLQSVHVSKDALVLERVPGGAYERDDRARAVIGDEFDDVVVDQRSRDDVHVVQLRAARHGGACGSEMK